jgi:hypothetical protein
VERDVTAPPKGFAATKRAGLRSSLVPGDFAQHKNSTVVNCHTSNNELVIDFRYSAHQNHPPIVGSSRELSQTSEMLSSRSNRRLTSGASVRGLLGSSRRSPAGSATGAPPRRNSTAQFDLDMEALRLKNDFPLSDIDPTICFVTGAAFALPTSVQKARILPHSEARIGDVVCVSLLAVL